MSHIDLLIRREELEQQLSELAGKAKAGCEISRDGYAAALNRLAVINAKIGD